MLRSCLSVLLALLVVAFPSGGSLMAQAPPADAEVAAGMKQVDDGDYDRAILTLDNAARRLAGDPARAAELSQAYLYLGIAYIGKGHEAAAKAKFREALKQIKDLTLSPEKFPPKVIDAFEEAKHEAATAAAEPAPVGKKGGSKKALVIGGLAAAAAVGVAVAAGGGGDSSSAGGGGTGTGSGGGLQTLSFTGTLPNAGGSYECKQIVATRSGTMEARLNWTNGQLALGIICQEHDPPYVQCPNNSNRTSNTSAVLTTPVTQKTYDVCPYNNDETQDNYTMVVTFP